jgi:hypothetical protein
MPMSADPASGEPEPPYSEASIWLGRVTTMIAPGLVGLWADRQFGTSYLGLIGFVVGLTAGITQLLVGPRSILQKPRRK